MRELHFTCENKFIIIGHVRGIGEASRSRKRRGQPNNFTLEQSYGACKFGEGVGSPQRSSCQTRVSIVTISYFSLATVRIVETRNPEVLRHLLIQV